MRSGVEVADLAERPELWSPGEVAAVLRIRRGLVYAMLERGWLPSVRVGRLIRVPSDAVTRFIETGGRRP